MKIMDFKRDTILILMILALISFFSSEVYSQTIRKIKFNPPGDPPPGSILKLSISLLSSGEVDRTVSIHLITWRDLNNDCKYTEGEEVEHPVINVKDNEEGKDEESSGDKIRVRVYDVPVDHPPQKYTVIVTTGRDSNGSDSKSKSIIVPLRKDAICNPTNTPSDWSLRKVLSIPYETARGLRGLKDILKREQAKEEYQGGRNLYVYALKEKKLERIAHSDETFYLSPTWSFDSKKIAIVVSKSGKKEIAWADMANKKLQVVTSGADDKDPFWIPDDINILFLRGNRLHTVNTRSKKEVIAFAEKIQVDQILGVSQGNENVVQIIYEAPNPHNTETKEVYMLELDSQLKQKSVNHLVDSPAWFLIPVTSPLGDRVVFSEKLKDETTGKDNNSTIFIRLISGKEVKPLFQDQHNYYEPSWSPDGNKIVFVSDRPE